MGWEGLNSAGGSGVDTSGSPEDNDYAKFTDADTIEGRSYSEVRSDLNIADGADVTGSNAPQAHDTTHQNGGADEISVAGLSGTLADDQHVLDSEVESVITAELANGQSIDNAIDSLITTHAAAGDAHHTESHTVASHSDTTATGDELEELTDGSETTLHSHAGGSAKEYASFYLSTGGITGATSTEVTLTINETSLNSDTDIFELASSQVTVNKTADFEISFQVSFNSSGSARTEYNVWLEQDASEVAGSRTANYQRGYDDGSTSSCTIQISVTSGEVFQLRTIRTDGAGTAGYQDDNGTRLSFKEL